MLKKEVNLHMSMASPASGPKFGWPGITRLKLFPFLPLPLFFHTDSTGCGSALPLSTQACRGSSSPEKEWRIYSVLFYPKDG